MSGKHYTSHEVQRIIDVYPTGDLDALAVELNRTKKTLIKYASKDLGLKRNAPPKPRPPKPPPPPKIKKPRERPSREVVQKRLDARRLKNKYIDVNFFENVGPAQAYVLGFILTKGRGRYKPRKIIRVSHADESKIHHLKKLLGANYKVQPVFECFMLELSSSLLYENLRNRWKLFHHKSLDNPALPVLSEELMPNMVLGMFDAQGEWLPNTTTISFTGPLKATCELGAYIKKRLGISEPRMAKVSVAKFWRYKISWTGEEGLKVRQWIDDNSPLELRVSQHGDASNRDRPSLSETVPDAESAGTTD
jgi:hypothetical protein